ncbi:hypothetical protein NC651_020754 [Populus alba x Populus x berolinensis]|nr:hypothetical protein NC651_020754 [Populus alba x Populus x berolinensis]
MEQARRRNPKITRTLFHILKISAPYIPRGLKTCGVLDNLKIKATQTPKRSIGSSIFTLKGEMEESTCSFSEKYLLGKGGFGRVYRGILRSGEGLILIIEQLSFYNSSRLLADRSIPIENTAWKGILVSATRTPSSLRFDCGFGGAAPYGHQPATTRQLCDRSLSKLIPLVWQNKMEVINGELLKPAGEEKLGNQDTETRISPVPSISLQVSNSNVNQDVPAGDTTKPEVIIAVTLQINGYRQTIQPDLSSPKARGASRSLTFTSISKHTKTATL